MAWQGSYRGRGLTTSAAAAWQSRLRPVATIRPPPPHCRLRSAV